MIVASLRLDLLLGDVHSLKEKRALVRPLIADLRRVFAVHAAETGWLDLHRRAEIGVALVGADGGHSQEVLRRCEDFVADRPEFQLLQTRLRVWDDDDDE